MKKLELHQCPLCDCKVAEVINRNVVFRHNYRSIWMLLSTLNGNSTMEVSICDSCKKLLTYSKVKKIIDRIKHTWDLELNFGKFKTDTQKKQMHLFHDSVAVIRYADTRKELIS